MVRICNGNVIVDPQKKALIVVGPVSSQELYNEIMDTFDEPAFMVYSMPFIGSRKIGDFIELQMINGWILGGHPLSDSHLEIAVVEKNQIL